MITRRSLFGLFAGACLAPVAAKPVLRTFTMDAVDYFTELETSVQWPGVRVGYVIDLSHDAYESTRIHQAAPGVLSGLCGRAVKGPGIGVPGPTTIASTVAR